MPSDDLIIYGDELVKAERSARLIKKTSLFHRGFSFINETDLLINLMQEYGDITIDQASKDPILRDLAYSGHTRSTKSKVAVLLGKYAEALMVLNCNERPPFNRHFARKARFGKKSPNDHLDNFTAIATGSPKTKENYPMHYQYTESQRDIVWVDRRDTLQLLTVPKRHGATAGLQLKVSYDWENLKGKLTQYYYPILYLPLSDDWSQLNSYIERKKGEKATGFDHVTLLELDHYSESLLNTLYSFENDLRMLIEGKRSVRYLIDKSIDERDVAKGHAFSQLPRVEEEILISAQAIKEAQQLERDRQRWLKSLDMNIL